MTRITACPQCQTRFRVTAEQLEARNGNVRCGRCSHVFNAYDTLAEEEPAPAEVSQRQFPPPPEFQAIEEKDSRVGENIPEENPESPPAAPMEGAAEENISAAQAEVLPEELLIPPQDEAPPEILDVAESFTPPETAQEPEPEARPEVRVVRIQPPPQKIEPKVSPERPKYGPPPKPRRAWPWVLASLPLLAGLAGQGIYYFRDAIAANYPPTRPLLEQACSYLQCRIDLPRNPDLLGIESSELHADPARANIVVLTSVLRNRASHVQAYPALELTLTNAKDEMVARRVLSPKEYVRQTASIAQGIPARGDVAVKLLMDLGDLKAEGYRLYLFYPS